MFTNIIPAVFFSLVSGLLDLFQIASILCLYICVLMYIWKSYLLASPIGCQPSGLHSATPSPCCGEGAASGPTGRVPPLTYRDSGGS